MKNHKIIARVLKYIAAAYVAACIALSVLVSSGVLRWEILERRAPFLIVDVAVTSVEGSDGPGHHYGYDQHGEYIGFRGGAEEYPEGLNVVSLMVYNPFTNYADDIAARYDVASWN